MVNRKANSYRHNYECMHKPTRDEMTNSGIVEEEGKVEEKTKACSSRKD